MNLFDQIEPLLGEGLDYQTRKINVPALKKICAEIDEQHRAQKEFFAEPAMGIRSALMVCAGNLQMHSEQVLAAQMLERLV